ncbi:hypothetical protein A5784_03695 [Mycobacterium sp. 852013-50091_SCH5140682]|uniref:sugar ABC transporter substrate-binding protein n=1 Tax=Mycobacterium sp. 852013-50091_SCH5140682 TaxID=1834109 RepID=UPI0007E969F4|nr:substrate-binding domain-containing protein [Mycobacterium sp. 852013-50091_SCH5140682]OBC11938.1 hypothetical protein A5784_03695 [Mycobacterium sp. 852013-50091_SCH5140682]
MPKNIRPRGLHVLAAAVLAVSATACANPASQGSKGGGYLIGVDFPSQNQARWGFEAKTFEEQAGKHGDKVIVNYANYSTSKQTSDVETMLQQGIDVLVLGPVDSTAAAALVTRAQSQGVKVITYDVGVTGATADYAVERNNYEAGKMHVESALAAVPTGNYAIIRGDRSTSVAQGIGRAYDDLLRNKPGVNVVYDQWTPAWDSAQAQRYAEAALLDNGNNIDAFIVSWDYGAQGVAQALKTAGISRHVYVTGTDGSVPSLANIATGRQSETVWTHIDSGASSAADIAHALASHGEVPQPDDTVDGVKTHYMKLTNVDAANLCEFVTTIAPAGWASVEQVYGPNSAHCA